MNITFLETWRGTGNIVYQQYRRIDMEVTRIHNERRHACEAVQSCEDIRGRKVLGEYKGTEGTNSTRINILVFIIYCV